MGRGFTRYTPPRSRGEAAIRCLFWSACSIALGCLTYGAGFLILPFAWWLFLRELQGLAGTRNQTQRPIRQLTTIEPSSDNKEFRQWLVERMQSVGYNFETAPDDVKDAYKSGNPKDLKRPGWQENWRKYKKIPDDFPLPAARSKKAWQVVIHGCVASGGDWPGDYNYWTSKKLAEMHAASKVDAGWKDVQVVEVDPPGRSGLRPTIQNQWRQPTRPQVNIGPRGGRYTMENTKDGRPYRRYF